MALLELKDVHAYYGNIQALKGVSFYGRARARSSPSSARTGRARAPPSRRSAASSGRGSGEIWFDGVRIDGHNAADIVAQGISQSPEGRRVFPRMTVQENLEMGAFQRKKGPEVTADFERVFTLFPRLRERRLQHGGTLSGGEQQMLAIGRALMAQPAAAPPR